MFRSLAVYNYRAWFFGSLVSNLGTWMQATAMSWVVLTELTRADASAMGFTAALQFLPSLLLVPLTGRIVDRFDRRFMLFITEAALGAVALIIGILLVVHAMTLPLMLCLAAVTGVAIAFESPMRQAFVADLVTGDDTVNAVSLNSVQFNVARLAGPALAGVLIGLIGSGWVFMLNAVTFIALIVALAMMRPDELAPRVHDVASARMTAAYSYVRRRPDLILLFAVVFISSAFAVNFPIYAAAMALEFRQPAWGFGLLTSCYAVGSLSGAFFVARQRTTRMRRIVAFSFLVCGSIGVSALMPQFWAYAAVSAVVGYAIVTQMANANAYMQTHTDRSIRGRVLVIYVACFTGGAPFGAPLIGWAANTWGARGAVIMVSAAGLVAALGGLCWYLGTGRVQRARESRLGFSITATRPIPTQLPGPIDPGLS